MVGSQGNGADERPQRARRLVASDTFTQLREMLVPDEDLFNDAMAMALVHVTRNPELYTRTTADNDERELSSFATPLLPAFRVVFSFDDEVVTLLWLEEQPGGFDFRIRPRFG